MVHLGPLPGSPGYRGDLDAVIAAGVADGLALEEAGFEAALVENFGDAPFFADDVPKATVAAMTAAVSAVASAVGIPVGVNVLRNDAVAGIAVACAAGAALVRVNVLTGTMFTDQGPIVGRAAEVARARVELGAEVLILADVFVKHATPPPGLTLEQATRDTVERGGADAVVVSGPGTGRRPTMAMVRTVADAAGGRPVYVGSGVTAATIPRYLSVAHGAIVGTSIKRGGVAVNPIDPKRARAVSEAALNPRRTP